PEASALSLHDALPIWERRAREDARRAPRRPPPPRPPPRSLRRLRAREPRRRRRRSGPSRALDAAPRDRAPADVPRVRRLLLHARSEEHTSELQSLAYL